MADETSEAEEEAEEQEDYRAPYSMVGSVKLDELTRAAEVLGWKLKRGSKGTITGDFEHGWFGLPESKHMVRVLAQVLAEHRGERVYVAEWRMGPRGKPRARGRCVDERQVWESHKLDWTKGKREKCKIPKPIDLEANKKQYKEGAVSVTPGDDWLPEGPHGSKKLKGLAVTVRSPALSEPTPFDLAGAHYVRWRLLVLGHCRAGSGPDLSRWERRAARRARLDEAPSPGDGDWATYLEEWLPMTEKERSQGPRWSHLVGAWKFDPGLWAFTADELAVMRRSLPHTPSGHEPNDWQQQIWEQFGQLVEGTDSLEFEVPPFKLG